MVQMFSEADSYLHEHINFKALVESLDVGEKEI